MGVRTRDRGEFPENKLPGTRGVSGGDRSLRITAALLTLVVALGAGVAQGKKKKPGALPPPPDVPGHVNYLARQLYGLPLDESAPITSQIQTLVVDHLKEWLADRAPSDVEIRRELENVFAKLRYPFFGQPAVFDEPWKGGILIGAGYTLGWSDYDRVNVIALFEHREAKTRLAALTNFVPRTDLHYTFLSTPGTEDFRFIVYGTRLGKSQPRMTAILYSFDGQTLKSLWETHDIYDGKMEAGRDRVVIRYLKEDEYIRETAAGRKPPRHEAVYRITPKGLEIETDHEIRF